MKHPTLRRRLYALFGRWFLLFLGVLALVTFFSLSRFRQAALEERMLLARSVAHYLDSTIEATIHNLGRLASQLPSLDAAAASSLRSYRFQGPFREAIYLLDDRGKAIVADPEFATPLPRRELKDHEAVTPLFDKPGEAGRRSLAVIQPFRRGDRRYFLVSEMNPLGSLVSTFLQHLATEPDLHVFVVDSNGVVIAAPDQKELFRVVDETELIGDRIAAHRPLVLEDASCIVCDGAPADRGFLTVMVPLRFAPWGVIVQQHERQAFAALYTWQTGLLAGGGLLVLMGLLLSRALLKSVVAPIKVLSDHAERLRRGDLASPIRVAGDHEIELLAGTLDAARTQLASTLGELQALNENLEGQIANRTRVLKEQYDNLRFLHDVSRVSTEERDLGRLIPRILQLVCEHYGLPAAALVATPMDTQPIVYRFPDQAPLPWLQAGAQAPAGWQQRDLVHQGRPQGRLYYPCAEGRDEGVMEALQQQLALSLHGTYLLKQTLAQDAQRRVLVQRLLTASEEERRRIARELHDEISQLLTVIQVSLDEVTVDAAEMQQAKDLLSRTQREIHRIIYDLRPSLLDDLGLSAAVKWHATNYLEPQNIEVSLEVEDDLALPAEVQIATFRIYQEIITNVLRHARADRVSVELYATADELVLAVEDDGVGFSPDEKREGTGIVGMRERAALVGGSITIDSSPGTGTVVRLRIPLRS